MENNIGDIEEALLGLILTNQKLDDKLSQVFVFLDKSYFSTKQNQEAFEMFKYFFDNNIKEFDILIINKYVKDYQLTNVLTHEYLNTLLNKAGFISSLNFYLSTISENHAKIRLKNSLENSLKEINVNNSDALIESLRNDLFKIEDRKISSEFQKGGDVAKKVIEEVLSNKKEIKGLKTGFPKLDEITTGLQKGDLIILAARPSVGKTAFALNLAMNIVLLANKSVAFFSLEMPAEQLIQRMLSAISHVNNYKFKEPQHLVKEEKENILIAYDKLKNKNFFIDDSGSIKLNEIIWKSKRLKDKNQLDLIIIDYMQLIPTDSYNGNRQQEVSKISRSLKQLARELNIPILALSQLNRRVEERESKKPMMSDLRESGSIEQDADIIAFLYRDDYYNKNNSEEDKPKNKHLTELNIAKHRNGSIGTIEFLFDSATGKFTTFKHEELNN